jgi:uncharacterized membrane protein
MKEEQRTVQSFPSGFPQSVAGCGRGPLRILLQAVFRTAINLSHLPRRCLVCAPSASWHDKCSYFHVNQNKESSAMNNLDRVCRLAISSMIAVGAIAGSSHALAAKPGMEQCAGIVKAGKNDCATSTNACHSHATVDNSPEAWIYVPKGTCERLSGTHLVQVEEPAKK